MLDARAVDINIDIMIFIYLCDAEADDGAVGHADGVDRRGDGVAHAGACLDADVGIFGVFGESGGISGGTFAGAAGFFRDIIDEVMDV